MVKFHNKDTTFLYAKSSFFAIIFIFFLFDIQLVTNYFQIIFKKAQKKGKKNVKFLPILEKSKKKAGVTTPPLNPQNQPNHKPMKSTAKVIPF